VNGLLDEATRLAGWAGVSASRGWPTLSAALGDDVRRLSDAYNQSGHAPARWDPGLQAARLLFFLPRDVLKTAAWARDAARAAPTRPLRVLDLGAGLGATSIGFADALRAVGGPAVSSVTLVDAEPTGLTIAADVVRVALPEVRVETRVADLRGVLHVDDYDVVLFGQVLCELDRDLPDEPRADAHLALLQAALRMTAADGLLFVLEPALKPGTRHLQRVRDRLVAAGHGVVAPCTHRAPCPMLARPQDWCHGWAAGALPDALHPAARAAGLRWEGLTSSRLVVTHAPKPQAPTARAVGPLQRTMGRSDVWWCTATGTLERAGRLDRHRTDANAAWDDVVPGDAVTFDGLGVPPSKVTGATEVVRRAP
jgi:SAM-dependent methyltransferase